MRVAVMQPYFIPYAGYFRLLAAADVFVIFDCVQFPRRGWVHRNKLTDSTGDLQWLTLSIQHCPQDTLIKDLIFAANAAGRLDADLNRFPATKQPGDAADILEDMRRKPTGSVADYLCDLVLATGEALGFTPRFVRSSTLEIAPELRAGARVRAIARAIGATTYVNAPNGRALYAAEDFAVDGLQLRFLPDYPGPIASIFERISEEGASAVREDILRHTDLLT